MKIPMGDGGQLTPQTRPTATPSITPLAAARPVDDGGMGAAGQRLGNTAMSIADNALDEVERAKKQEAQKQAARAEQIQQLTAHAAVQTGLADLNEELTVGVKTGAVSKDDARKQWAERSTKVVTESVAGLPGDLGALVTAQMKEVGGRLNNKLEDSIRLRDQSVADAGLITYKEQLQRLSASDLPGAVSQWEQTVRTAGPAAGWTPEKVEKEVQGFKETVYYTKAYEAVSLARNNRGQLELAEKAIADMKDLDPQKKAVLLDRASSYKFALDQKAELQAQRAQRQAEAHLKRAEATFQTFQAVSDKGLALDPAYIDTVIKQTAGTPYQAGVVGLARQSQENGGLAAQPLSAQRAALDAVQAQIARDGNTPALAKRRDQIEKVVRGTETDISKDPLRAFVERSPVAADFKPLDTSSIPALTKGLQERAPLAEMARLQFGRPVSPLTNEEAEPVRRMIAALPPREQAAALAGLATVMGRDSARGLAAQLQKDDPTLGYALSQTSNMTTAGRSVAEMIVRGGLAKKDGTSTKNEREPDVKLKNWSANITTQLENVYGNQTLTNEIRDQAILVAHSLASENGGKLAERDLTRAVNFVIGGEIVEHNGRKVPLPAGITQDMLEKRTRSVSAAELSKQAPDGIIRAAGVPVPMDEFLKKLPGQELTPVRPGEYAVLINGRPAVNSKGVPVLIGVR